MTKRNIRSPYFVVNPKSYIYGKEAMELALEADKLAAQNNLDIFFTAQYVDIPIIYSQTSNIIVTAQHMDPLKPGRGMGYVVPEALKEAGARAVFLNHAEHPIELNKLVATINRAKEVGMYTIVCADSLEEAKAIAMLNPDILLCEPTNLIGTGKTSDENYLKETTATIKSVSENILVMQAAGISNGEDVYNTLVEGADGTGCTSGIVCASNPKEMLNEMIQAVVKAKNYKLSEVK
ncbi:triose-phosphate isomerase [Bacillaceae bacterium Marseille-Q3522]|nr:triose-phosphate isomerase [Bacillaceae bacterium Marseille-Q3522]